MRSLHRFYGFGAVLSIVCGYYFLQSGKTPASEQAKVKEIRKNEEAPHKEVRDPRDSGVKTLEQKKQKEAGNLK
jgi:hypothetical protein